jgi:glyoxylase-like metal-dependent hydrolase (beta-lactamase superfamily II)
MADQPRAPYTPPLVETPTAHATRLLAPNPGVMTLEGTNTWLLAAPDATSALVVDPGPDDERHLRAVIAHAAATGRRVAGVLLTHGHPDHAAGARRFAELAGVGVRALDPAHRLGGEGLNAGDVVELDGLELRVLGTPGHTADSLTFLLAADGALLTGDTVLGHGSTVVAHPDGRLADYLASLRALRALVDDGAASTVLPGHGPVLRDAADALDGYLAHRARRLEQVAAAVARLDADPARVAAMDVVRLAYADVDEALWPAAELSVRAQLEYLASGRDQG